MEGGGDVTKVFGDLTCFTMPYDMVWLGCYFYATLCYFLLFWGRRPHHMACYV